MASINNLDLDPDRWMAVERLAQSLVDDGTLPAVAVQVTSRGRALERPLVYGRQRLADDPGTLTDDSLFLVASLTKPVVAMAVLLLVERGDVTLNDRVVELLPEFAESARRPMLVRHLLTHTSGLPDMLPNNTPLRQSHSPFAKFFEGTCAVSLDFPPGHGMQYQSMGFVLAAEIIQRVSGRSYGEFLREELFDPLGMHDTALGAPDVWFNGSSPTIDRVAELPLPDDQRDAEDWGWNSRYWRQFGAPWGGLLSTVDDYARFCAAMIDGGGVFSPATVEAATCNQLVELANVPEVDRRCRAWGLGWRFNWPTQPSTFGNLLGPDVVGHWGATGTLCWIDREAQRACVILSTRPFDAGRNHMVRLSNAVTAAFR